MPLTDEASDAFDAFESAYPYEAMHFDSIVQHLQDRFHGSETLEKFKKEFNDCEQKSRETVQDFAARLEKKFNQAYPPDKDRTKSTQQLRLGILRDKFIAGLETTLQERLRLALAVQPESYKASAFTELIKLASRLHVEINNKSEKKVIEFLKAVNDKPSPEMLAIQSSMAKLEKKIEKFNVASQAPCTGSDQEEINKGGKSQQLSNQEVASWIVAAVQQAQIQPTLQHQYAPANNSYYQPRNQYNPPSQAPRPPPNDENNARLCHLCNSPEHLKNECPKRRGCRWCRETILHPRQICPMRPQNPPRPCNTCRQWHWFDQCPERRNAGYRSQQAMEMQQPQQQRQQYAVNQQTFSQQNAQQQYTVNQQAFPQQFPQQPPQPRQQMYEGRSNPPQQGPSSYTQAMQPGRHIAPGQQEN